MPKYQIDVTEAAKKDLIKIVDYIADDNPAAALKLRPQDREKHLIPFPIQSAIIVGFVIGSSTCYKHACVASLLAALIAPQVTAGYFISSLT